MKLPGWGRNGWILLLLAAMGILLFVLGGVLGKENRGTAGSDYAGYLEDRVRELCMSIDGVREAHVFRTLCEDPEAKAAVSGGMFGGEKTSSVPAVRGIAVVCTGGDSPTLRETVTRLISAALGIPTNRIRVEGSERK